MGIYADHGIEYLVVTILLRRVLVPIYQSDQRLLKSNWYLSKQKQWHNHHFLEKQTLITDQDFDVQLTNQEQINLMNLLKEYKGSIIQHGWYDTIKISTTHDL